MKRLMSLVAATLLMLTFFSVASADTYIVNTKDEPLNIRTAPQGGYDGILRQGAKVEVISIRDGWASFIHNGKIEYLYAEYLRPAGRTTSPRSTTASSTSTFTNPPVVSHYEEGSWMSEVWLSSPGRLIIRKSASEKGKCIGRVSNGTILYVVDEDDVWAKVIYKNTYAFVKKEFLVSHEECAPDYSTYQVRLADKTQLNVRTGPGTSYSICDFIAHDKYVNVSLIHDGWAKITYESGKTGYVQVKFLTAL